MKTTLVLWICNCTHGYCNYSLLHDLPPLKNLQIDLAEISQMSYAAWDDPVVAFFSRCYFGWSVHHFGFQQHCQQVDVGGSELLDSLPFNLLLTFILHVHFDSLSLYLAFHRGRYNSYVSLCTTAHDSPLNEEEN